MTPTILAALRRLDSNLRNVEKQWAASCLCCFGFLGSGEVTCPSEGTFNPLYHLCFQDVKVDDRSDPLLSKWTLRLPRLTPSVNV